jgi:hypothetical protein
MAIKQINRLKPGRLRALMTGMTVKALEEMLVTVLPELVKRRDQTKR